MRYALQDEPEKGRRLAIWALGALLGVAIQGGGLLAASRYEREGGLKKTPTSVVAFVVEAPPPPPPPPAPEPEPPPPPPPPPEPEPPPPPPPPPKPEPPKPKPKPPPKPKPEPPKPEPPKPEPPQAASEKPSPPDPAPVKIGVYDTSTDARAQGIKVDVGNTAMGEMAGTASAPVTGRPPSGDRTIEGTPEPPPPPPKPPVKTRASCMLPATSDDDYPRAARRAGVDGVVVLLATIGADGTVKSAKTVKGLGFGLDEKAVEIAQAAKCKPATVDGEPISGVLRLSVRFELRD